MSIGFRVKSGYAIAIVVEGSREAPVAVSRQIVQLCDPQKAETRQPYHSGVGEAEENQRAIAARVKVIERAAARSVDALLDGTTGAGRVLPSVGRVLSDPARGAATPLRAALVVGSTIDPATVGNPHIRAHASEGKLFRSVLEAALASRGVDCTVIVEKQLADTARRQLQRTDAQIRSALTAFGNVLGRPWRGDEKSAAIGAWLRL